MDDRFYFLIKYSSKEVKYVETGYKDKRKLRAQFKVRGDRIKKIEQLERALSPEEVGKLLALNLHA